ncbi:hypothetical protein IFR05_010870 [Cadophora sp. M221]|nr:hypothetical protein IFR05_010870 [Cadophora sp. M221]
MARAKAAMLAMEQQHKPASISTSPATSIPEIVITPSLEPIVESDDEKQCVEGDPELELKGKEGKEVGDMLKMEQRIQSTVASDATATSVGSRHKGGHGSGRGGLVKGGVGGGGALDLEQSGTRKALLVK